MIKEKSILIKLTHSDTELLKRFAWFKQQPGCNWTKTGSGTEDLPDLTISRQGVFLNTRAKQLSFHPSMAIIRLINLLRGESDRYLEATQLKAGDSLIDATMGLGTDALIGAWAVGETGNVLAIEQSPLIAAFVHDGLNHFKEIVPNAKNVEKQDVWAALARASRRIEVRWGGHGKYLNNLPSRSVDVVYFDPMFRDTCRKSNSILPLHRWSNHNPLDQEAVSEACRVARNRVVLKERKDSLEFQRLGFDILHGGRYSPIDYGIILV